MPELPAYRPTKIPVGAKRVFKGVLFDVYQWEQELFDGSFATFEMVNRSDGVVVFPILEDGSILLIKDSQPHREEILTAPTGGVDIGETPEEAARRELREETGYEPQELQLVATRPNSDRNFDMALYVFIGYSCKKVTEPDERPGEKIIPFPVSFDELIRLADEGKQYRGSWLHMQVVERKHNPEALEELRKLFSNKKPA